jgi:hypothetical protein
MALVLYPYVYLSARAMFLTQSASMLEVARTLGAGRLGTRADRSPCRSPGRRWRSAFRSRCSRR